MSSSLLRARARVTSQVQSVPTVYVVITPEFTHCHGSIDCIILEWLMEEPWVNLFQGFAGCIDLLGILVCIENHSAGYLLIKDLIHTCT